MAGIESKMPRRGLLGIGAGIAAAAAGGAAYQLVRDGTPADASPAPNLAGLQLRWWGNNSWEIRISTPGTTRTVLIDPWLTRLRAAHWPTRSMHLVGPF